MQDNRKAQLREMQDLVRVALGTEEFVSRLRRAGANAVLLEPVTRMAD